MSPLPPASWAEVSADFGHLKNEKYFLFVTDEYSHYVVVDILDSISITPPRQDIRRIRRASLPQNGQLPTI